jgi:outer membrane protein OmpA-like peptidoglycan-associated protein
MPSATALKAILGASLGLGVIDLAVIDVVLAPAVLEPRQGSTATVTSPSPTQQVDTMKLQVTDATKELDHVETVTVKPAGATPATVVETQCVYFATRSAILDNRVRATLDQLAKRGGTFVLEGHADYRGGESENDKLSELRAQAVADYLAARGIAKTRIDARHVGEAAETAASQLWRDRRVDIQITREASP